MNKYLVRRTLLSLNRAITPKTEPAANRLNSIKKKSESCDICIRKVN